jgi:hypothetical protein
MKVAERFGLVVDDGVTGNFGGCFLITLDHPTHSFGGDCRSIHVEDCGTGSRSPADCAWADAIERMNDEGPLLEPCLDPECDYHAREMV